MTPQPPTEPEGMGPTDFANVQAVVRRKAWLDLADDLKRQGKLTAELAEALTAPNRVGRRAWGLRRRVVRSEAEAREVNLAIVPKAKRRRRR